MLEARLDEDAATVEEGDDAVAAHNAQVRVGEEDQALGHAWFFLVAGELDLPKRRLQ